MKYILNGDVAFIGDIHGRVSTAAYHINKAVKDSKVKHLVFLGDIGFGFFEEDILETQFLYNFDNSFQIWFIRGNHDNPARWKEINLAYADRNLHFVKDNDILNISGRDYLVVGGGISIDREYRQEGYTYWSDEFPSTPIIPEGGVYGILSHSGICPPNIPEGNHHLIINGEQSLKDDVKREKELFYKLLADAKPKEWYYGHYHNHSFFEKDGCHFFNLDINEVFIKDDNDEYLQEIYDAPYEYTTENIGSLNGRNLYNS